MPNAEKLRATQALVEANLTRWDQSDEVSKCGTSFCWFGWAAVAEGYRPTFDEYGNLLSSTFRHKVTGQPGSVFYIVREAHELSGYEADAIYLFQTTDITEMRDRVESVIRGEWR